MEEEVKQLFRDVLKKDPSSRPTAMDLLQKPVILSACDYGACFNEYYDSEDAEDLDSVPPQTADFMAMDSDSRELSHISSSGHPSLSSFGDVVCELPQFVENQNPNRGSQDSGVGGDLDTGINSGLFSAQVSMRSSSSGSAAAQSRLVHQDSGLEDMPRGDCPLPDRPGE